MRAQQTVLRDDSKNKTVSVRMPEEKYFPLDTIARVEGIPVAEAIRRAIDLLIETKSRDDSFRQRVLESVQRAQLLLKNDLKSGSEESAALQGVIDEVLAGDDR
jgi:predicted DNA-binding protein